MSLENVTEAVNLKGESKVDDELVAVFNCRIAENGVAGPITQQISNHDLYQEHRAEVRQDLQEFQLKVWEVEDRLTETGE